MAVCAQTKGVIVMKIGNYEIAVSLLAALIFSSGLAAAQVGVESNTGNIAPICS